MIDSLIELKNFASFKDFSGTVNFKKVNLFFGYNGSGKTSITRFFKCLNDNKFNQDFQNANFKITLDGDKTKYTESNFPKKYNNKIKIFNIDFINNELKFDESKVNKISAIIGKDNINLKEQIEALEKEKKELFDENGKLKCENKQDDLKKDLEKKYKREAENIRSILKIENSHSYTKDTYKNDFEKYDKLKITENDYLDAKSLYISNIKECIPDETILSFKNIVQDFPKDEIIKVIEILKQSVKRKDIDIADNVISWIKDGINIHKEEHCYCKFCNQTITDELWKQIQIKFSELSLKDPEYEKIEQNFLNYKYKIFNYIDKISNFSINLSQKDFVTENYCNEYFNKKEEFDKYLSDIKEYLKSLKDVIIKKDRNKSEVFTYDFENILFEALDKIKLFQEQIIKIFQENNKKIRNLEIEKDSAKQIVIKFEISKKYNEFSKIRNDIDILNDAISKGRENLLKIDTKINEYKKELSNQKNIIDTINDKLKNFLDINLLFEFDQNSDSYILKRKTDGTAIPAKNLSEGEKNFIAFLYFIISLKTSSKKDKENEIIVIDDPVSSLDSNKLFYIGNMLLDNVNRYEQIFFLTHNFYFFVKIRDALKYKEENVSSEQKDEDLAIFEITCDKTHGSKIKKANQFVERHISEYMDIITKLKELLKNTDNDKDATTANLIRRVLEIFLSFKIPNGKSLYGKFKKLTKGNMEKYTYLWPVANSFSHTSEISSLSENIDFPYIAGTQEIKDLFNFIRETDPEHYDGLNVELNEDD